ncbi:MAG: hypothetical protein JXX28_00230 [Deltaproteobacteria bacterium]|nr:hypothetical protein [Deltaproteobacteria bacterium]
MTALHLLAGLAWATGTPPSAQVEVVDAGCAASSAVAPGAPLTLTYQVVALACPPGGPCSRLMDDPISAEELELFAEGCAGPLPGRFVPAGWRCGERPVWRWEGALPQGHRYRVIGWPPGPSASLTAEGAPEPLRCPPPARVEVTRPYAPEGSRETLVDASLALESLSVEPLEPGHWRLRWDLTVEDVARYYGGVTELIAEYERDGGVATALAGLSLSADRTRVQAQQRAVFTRTLTGVLYREVHEECVVREHTDRALLLDGIGARLPLPPLDSETRLYQRCPDVPDHAWLEGPPRPAVPVGVGGR